MAEKLPSGAYRTRVRWTDNNKVMHCESFTADTAEEADYLAAEFKYKHKRTSKPSTTLVGDMVDKYIELKSKILSVSTVADYKKKRRLYFGSIAQTPVQSFNNAEAQRWINSLSAQGLAYKTIKNTYGLLTASTKVYSPDKRISVSLPQRKKQEFVIPEKEDIEQLLEIAEGTYMYLPILFASDCGMRRSEIVGLEWSDIDLKKKTVHVQRAIVKDEFRIPTVKGTKSYDGDRVLDLSDKLIKELKKHSGKKPCESDVDNISNSFKRLSAKIGHPEYHFHLLRHYYASVLISLNIPMTYIVKKMGHSSENMVKQVYGHIINEKDKEVNQIILDYFNGNSR